MSEIQRALPAHEAGPAVIWRTRHRALFRGFFTSILLLIALSMVACDRNIEPFEPGEEARAPDLARIFPAPAGQMGSPEGSDQATVESTGATRGAVPPSRAEAGARSGPSGAAPAAAVAVGASAIEGLVELAEDARGARPDRGVLFVIARPQGSSGGPPLAVLRIPDPEFPVRFRIGPEHVMIPGLRFEGAIALSARLDGDGNAMTRDAQDLSSETAAPLAPGDRDVRLVLARRG